MLEYQLDQIEIVDFLLIAKFWACLLFFHPPSSRVYGDGEKLYKVVAGSAKEFSKCNFLILILANSYSTHVQKRDCLT